MINLKDKTLTFDGKTEPIHKYEVWWMGVDGLYIKIEEALQDAERNKIEPNMLRAVSVALSETFYEVIVR